MKKDKEQLKFRIDQLRKDKMVCALESIALTFIVELSYILLSILFRLSNSKLFAVFAIVIPLAYFFFMAIGNITKCREIKKLEKELYSK